MQRRIGNILVFIDTILLLLSVFTSDIKIALIALVVGIVAKKRLSI